MRNFVEVYTKGCRIDHHEIPMLLQCTNIRFGHTIWTYNIFGDEMVLRHVVNNIVDINEKEYGRDCGLLYNVILCVDRHYAVSNDMSLVNYVCNNGYINKNTLNIAGSHAITFSPQIASNIHTIRKLVNYLTEVSLNKFTGFYNLEKYYYICHIMLLIMKTQQKIPSIVIKHLIIPFIYQ